MNNIALFGGAYNPIGLHHQHISDLIYMETGMSTWFMPCFHHVNKQLDNSRSTMVKMVCDEILHAHYCDWEISHQSDGKMYNTITELKNEFKDCIFFIVIGGDNANSIQSSWFRGCDLIKENPFIVIQRSNVPLLSNWACCKPHRVLNFNSDMSSTSIRKSIEEGDYDFAKQNLNNSVWSHIKENRLYGY